MNPARGLRVVIADRWTRDYNCVPLRAFPEDVDFFFVLTFALAIIASSTLRTTSP